MQIKSVFDSSFKKYGKVVTGIDCSKILEALATKPMPADSVVYVPGDADLEAAAGAIDFSKSFFGGLEAQIGYCNGNNKLLNAVEYHRCSEVNIALYDTVLLVGDQRDIEDDFTKTLSRCHPVTMEDIKNEKFLVRLTGGLARLVAPLL